ncbi:hypothetical protein [Naumannella halotolerans]|uniref:Uncharacterized protein n=1 Tax=Naumannella halotolerans TaxID=993414 RepID=A0A4R7J1F1_9ACTN|nr:hypothetical protein [Naumannella halotolerans]TDT30079.1 hypothetical protein CLV29_3103 [Naumannella halotolerans]
MSSDGLAALNQKREQRSRRVPPSRHRPKPPQSASAPAATIDTPPAPSQPTPPIQSATADDKDQLERKTIYLDVAGDDFLAEVAFSARKHRPKVDASGSAVVRYALERLRNEMTADAVVEVLKQRADRIPGGGAVGRRRV